MTVQCWRGLISAGLWIGLLTTGCTTIIPPGGPPVVIYNTPFGSTRLNPGGPPSGPVGVSTTTSVNPDGVYHGIAVPLSTGGGLCRANIDVRRFRVHGRSVRWGNFRGTIEKHGLQMVFGNTWVFGQFVGDQFQGQISSFGRSGPGCSYMMSLTKVGA
jgi:hypothetical protein